MMKIFFTVLKYWKAGALALLVALALFHFHLAQTRGEKLAEARKTLDAERVLYQGKIRTLEKVLKNEQERNNFRTKQNRRLKLAQGAPLDFDPDSLDVYERLRARQAAEGRR